MERAVVIVPEGKIRMQIWSGAGALARLHVDAQLPLFWRVAEPDLAAPEPAPTALAFRGLPWFDLLHQQHEFRR